MTPHISAKEGEIATTVIMPGDPLRAKYIAENFLENYEQVNSLRNMFAYTGFYKGKKITVMGSGMGMPSIGIYSYELYKFYGVENIIRIGTCGSNREDIKVLDVILAKSSYSLSTLPKLFDGTADKIMYSSEKINEQISLSANENNINLKTGTIITSDIFNVYVDNDKYMANYPSDLNSLASEMEAFCLFYMAKILNKHASCLLTVVDSPYDKKEISGEERQTSLNDMIKVALDACIKL